MLNILDKLKLYAKMIKFSHTVFALPFAISAVILASYEYPIKIISFFWIIFAMIFARSASMGFNRIVDAKIDAKNPRTKEREIPSGKIDIKFAFFFCLYIFHTFYLFSLYAWKGLFFLFFFCFASSVFLFIYKKIYIFLSYLSWFCDISCTYLFVDSYF